MAPRSLVLVFADHGFRQARRTASGHGRRYAHGGATPQEVITPLALLHRP